MHCAVQWYQSSLVYNPKFSMSMVLTVCLCLSQKAQQKLKLPVAPSLQRLQVYRWASQALATPPDHPLIPLVWQKFLQFYLRQPGPEYGYDAHTHYYL